MTDKNIETAVEDLELDEAFTPVQGSDGVQSDEDSDVELVQGKPRPGRYSVEWSDFVMGLLDKSELVNGSPKCEGLRRVAGLLYGDMDFTIHAHAVHGDYAAVTGILQINGQKIEGCAECTAENSERPYNLYPLATADTRAELRALKKFLGLRNVLGAEESCDKARLTMPATNEDRTEGSIVDAQISFIDLFCGKQDISVKDVVTAVVGQHKSIKDLSHSEALSINERLDSWSRDKDDEYAKLSPYDANWRSNFEK